MLSRHVRRREESGLTDAELALCSHSCAIPSGRRQPSLNLAAAVAVVLAQCFELRGSPQTWPQHSLSAGRASLNPTCCTIPRPANRKLPRSGCASRLNTAAAEGNNIPRAASGGNGSSASDAPRTRLDVLTSPAPAGEVEALLGRWSALVRRAGLTDAESIAGWQGSHGRKRRTVGHVRAVLSRSRVTQKARCIRRWASS